MDSSINSHLRGQEVRFCTTRDGVRIAYATVGSGPPLVKAANWLNHLEFDWRSPIMRHLFEEFAQNHALVRYDQRGNGLSDWDAADFSQRAFVSDLEAVVAAAGHPKFALLGISQGGPIAIEYAVAHPERVTHLVLYGTYARGWAHRGDPNETERRRAMHTLIRQGWGQENPAFRQMFTMIFMPDSSPEMHQAFDELQRISTSPENAARLINDLGQLNVEHLLSQVRVPTLVLHCRGDAGVPFSEGRLLAAGIPGAKLVELPGRNHVLFEGTPEWERFCDEVRAFLGDPPRRAQRVPRPVSSESPIRPGLAANAGGPASAQWQPGDERAHYKILSALGAGGMGVVYRARDTRLERDVAVKVLPDALTTDPMARARLNREAQAASALNHPNICTIYEVGEAAGHAYIAMEYVEGRSLASAIPSDGMPLENVMRYGEQMADALAHAHDRNVLHRDLKSANVIITGDGRAKILDFGLAKRIGAETDAATLSQVSPLTQAGSVAGTLHYLPPEVLRGDTADARGDIWALGVVLYEMACGALPFQGRTSFEVTSAILREPTAPMPPRVPPGLRAVIQRCLAKEPGQRYQRASEVRAALEAIGSASSPALMPQDAAAASATQGSERREDPKTESYTRESLSVLGIWFLWILGVIALFALYMVISTQLEKWRKPEGAGTVPATSAPAAAPSSSEMARLTGGGKPSPNADANAYYEKAMLFLMARFDPPQARALLQKALEADPKFAHARATYALTHLIQLDSGMHPDRKWIYEAQAEVQQALRDDPESPSAHAILGAVYITQGRKELALPELQRALREQPDLLPGNVWMLFLEHMNGDYPAVMARAQRMRQLLPVFFPSQIMYAKALHETGDTAGAVRVLRGVLEQDSQNQYALWELARPHIESGDTKTARAFLERNRPEQRNNFRTRLMWALLFARENKRKEALREIDEGVKIGAESIPRVTLELAEVYARLGETETAVDWFDRAVRNGDERVEWFRKNPLLANLQEHPRFKRILESVEFRRAQKK